MFCWFVFFRRWEAEITTVSKAAAAGRPAFRGDPHVSHNVTNFEFFYEPFYVASDLVPPHDERFLGYGFTRNTQVRHTNGTTDDYLAVSAKELGRSGISRSNGPARTRLAICLWSPCARMRASCL